MAGYCSVKHTLKPSVEQKGNNRNTFAGEVIFSPNVPYGQPWIVNGEDGDYIVASNVVVCKYDENGVLKSPTGIADIRLWAGGEGSNPPDVAWNVIFKDIVINRQPAYIAPFTFDVKPNTSYDLGTVIPLTDPKTGRPLLQGQKGDKGDRGPQGERGERGPQGERGERGPQGERGLQGIQGLKGDRGERGPQGERGFKGEQGIQGVKGTDAWVGTNAEYTALKSKDPNRIYIILEV